MSNLDSLNDGVESSLDDILAIIASGLPSYTDRVNRYSEALVPYNTETTVLSYLVPVGQTFYVIGAVGWGDTDGEFFIRIDGTIVGGDRTTAAKPSCSLNYSTAPIKANAGSLITITTATYSSPSTHVMRATLLGGIL